MQRKERLSNELLSLIAFEALFIGPLVVWSLKASEQSENSTARTVGRTMKIT